MNKLQLAKAALREAERVDNRNGVFCLCGICMKLWRIGEFTDDNLELYQNMIEGYKRRFPKLFKWPLNTYQGSAYWWRPGDNESRIKFLKLIINNEENSI